jgi:hypothetical protein
VGVVVLAFLVLFVIIVIFPLVVLLILLPGMTVELAGLPVLSDVKVSSSA